MNLIHHPIRLLQIGATGAAIILASSCKPQEQWQSFNASGLKVDVPSAPKDLNAPIPADIASVTEEFKIWQSDGADCVITVSYSSYKQAPDPREAFDGGVTGMKQTFPDFSAKDASIRLDGRQAIAGSTTFSYGGQRHEGYMIAIVDGLKLWQVQIVPTGTGTTAVERAKASLKFE